MIQPTTARKATICECDCVSLSLLRRRIQQRSRQLFPHTTSKNCNPASILLCWHSCALLQQALSCTQGPGTKSSAYIRPCNSQSDQHVCCHPNYKAVSQSAYDHAQSSLGCQPAHALLRTSCFAPACRHTSGKQLICTTPCAGNVWMCVLVQQAVMQSQVSCELWAYTHATLLPHT